MLLPDGRPNTTELRYRPLKEKECPTGPASSGRLRQEGLDCIRQHQRPLRNIRLISQDLQQHIERDTGNAAYLLCGKRSEQGGKAM